MLNHRAHHGRRVLGPKRELLPIEGIGKGVHLLFDDVGDLANAAHEQGGGLQNRGSDGGIAIESEGLGHGGLQPLPLAHLLREQIVHALHAHQFVHQP